MLEHYGETPSERMVTRLCQQSFLKLWTHPNPKGKHGKELCDCLIVCGSQVVIISVKDSKYRATDDETGWKRWAKTAIEKSAFQIAGAERWLRSVDQFERHDGRVVCLPEKTTRRYHRVAVALGGRGQVPLQWGDFGHGFVHVCDEYSIGSLFVVLDTITDFIEFLGAGETLVRSGTHLVFDGGGIEDLIALYLLNGRSFEFESSGQERPDMLIVHADLWSGFMESEDFKNMKTEFKKSYIWDRLVDQFADDLLSGGMFDMHSKQITDNESALVTMALEPRRNRLIISEAFSEFLKRPELNSAARVVQGRKGHAFVFAVGSSDDREFRARELALRCLVVRGRLPSTHTVVGIATDRPGVSSPGYSSDIVYLHLPDWTGEDERGVRGIQDDLGYFKKVDWSRYQ